MVGLDGHKMRKSRGNLVLVSELRAAGFDPAAIRLAVLAHHYRDDWEWTDAGLAEAGLYSLAVKFAQAVNVLVRGFQLAQLEVVLPWACRVLGIAPPDR